MPKHKTRVWRFFASVKLALISLFILASISIIGTLIKQKQAPEYYIDEYGESMARFFQALNIPDMYGSWWFAALLGLFSLNLIICSIERLPKVWRMVVQDNLSVDHRQLEKMQLNHYLDLDLPVQAAAEKLQQFLSSAGWKKNRRLDRSGSSLIFAQKGAWTRLGVYVVHLSILVIFIGAMIGNFWGFQGYVFLPEGRSTDTIFLQGSQKPIPLDFELQCDRLQMSYYPNGMVKQSRVDLTVNDPERSTSFQKSTIVNDPLSYGGLTFYQADSYPIEEFHVMIRNLTTGRQQAFRVPPARDVAWPGTNVSFRIADMRKNQDDAVQQARFFFTVDGMAQPYDFWVKDDGTVTFRQAGEDFSVSFRQLSTVLLLITKDPGIFIVYSGCILLLLGLAVSFFMAHHRIWIGVTIKDDHGAKILISGTSNKHRPAFQKRFKGLVGSLEQNLGITTTRDDVQ